MRMLVLAACQTAIHPSRKEGCFWVDIGLLSGHSPTRQNSTSIIGSHPKKENLVKIMAKDLLNVVMLDILKDKCAKGRQSVPQVMKTKISGLHSHCKQGKYRANPSIFLSGDEEWSLPQGNWMKVDPRPSQNLGCIQEQLRLI